MKKLILIIFSFLILGTSFAIDQKIIDYLDGMGITIDKTILSKKQISRYEAAQYLNYAQCFDCILPPESIKKTLNYGWFQDFKKQDNIYLDDIGPQDPYYYCVTNLSKLDYIHGFPFNNPVCGGQFCGSNALSFGELFQIIVNIISPNIWSDYNIEDVDSFYKNIMALKGTQDEKNMNITSSDYDIAENLHKNYHGTYVISNFKEFFLYQKYCNLYPQDCSFKNFGDIKQGNYVLSMLNILHNQGFITVSEGINFNPSKKVSGEDLIKWLYKIKKINNCKIDNDYDKDSILNKNDDCMDKYDPNQTDTDGDGIGDVCDDDIDNDGIKNPIGIVDEKGNIVPSKITKDMDNCLFTVNNNQKDVNNNKIGDACEKQAYDLIGIQIKCSPLKGDAPLNTFCSSNTKGDIKKIVWTYKSKVIGEGKTINYIFKNEGDKIITATAIGKHNDTAKANSYFKVGKQIIDNRLKVGLQVFANPTSGPVGTKVIFKPKVKGSIDFIKWDFGDGSIYKRPSNKNLLKIYSKAGTYKVIARGYKANKVVGVSYMFINIYKKSDKHKSSSYLEAQPLLGVVDQPIHFTLKLRYLTEGSIEKVIWNFGDGTVKSINSITTTHSYSQASAYGVKVTIYTKDGQVIDNFITEKIVNSQTTKKYGAYIKAEPLKQKIGKKVKFTIIPDGFKKEDIKKVVWNFGDGTKDIIKDLVNTHLYYTKGKKYVTAYVILNDNDNVKVSLTEVIYGQDICLIGQKKLKCDMDHDGIPDMCDDDIDGDGVKNLLGVIKYENKDCSITDKNISISRLQEEQNLAKKGGEIDNCLFVVNPDQIDVNSNGIGDTCDVKQKDTDHDGIFDDDDACPLIPENYNGIEDEDGCPELFDDINNELSLKVDNCNTCPCHFADYGTPFIGGLDLKALLVDPYNPSTIYKISEPKTVK